MRGRVGGWDLSLEKRRRKYRHEYNRELLFLEFIEGLAFYPQAQTQDWGPGFCQGHLPAALPWAAPHEQRETGGRPLRHLLNQGRWRGEHVGCLYFPLRRRPAGAHRARSSKIRFPHILPAQNLPCPSGRRKQSIKQVWLWRVRGVRRPKEAFEQDSALFQTSPEVAASGNSSSLTH